ncbi:MAG: glycosyltransferase family 4 protein [Bacillota bacterium]
MKTKVLVVGSSLADKGGIVTVMQNINDSSISKEFRMDMVETYITGSVFKRLSIFVSGFFSYLLKLLFKRPDIIHIHMSYKGSFYRKSLFVLIAKLFNIPVIVHVHGSSFKDFYAGLSEGQKKYCRFILKKCDKLIVLSKEWYQYFSNLIPKDKVQVLYNGVTKSNFTLQKKNNDIPIALFMGRLGQRKGTYDLIEAIKLLKEKGIKGKFLLAGDGEVDAVNTLIEKYNLQEYVETLGWINGDQKKSLLETADILVLPSYNEGLPMAILEAMDYGLPIVSTPVGGIPEVIIDDKNGYLVNPGDVQNLAARLTDLIVNEELRYDMGQNNQRQIAEKYDLEVLLKDLSLLYKKLPKKVG